MTNFLYVVNVRYHKMLDYALQEDVEALQLQYLLENGVPLDDDEAFQQVLGH